MKNLSFITYNCHLGVFANTCNDDARREAIIADLKKLNPDIICLSEVWGDKDNKIKILEALEDTWRFNYYDDTANSKFTHGLLIMSKYPLYNNYVVPFNDADILESAAEKSFFHFCISADSNHSFRVFYTHTQAGAEKKDIRAKQFDQIKRQMDAYYPATPALFAGDLNVNAADSEYNTLCATFKDYDDLYKLLRSDFGYTVDPKKNKWAEKWSNNNGVPRRLDYIFRSKLLSVDWEAQKQDDIQVMEWMNSDHFPVYTKNLVLNNNMVITADNVFSSEEDARNEVDKQKKNYGDGTSVKLLINNKLSGSITQWGSAIWDGSFQKNPPPFITKGLWAGIFFHHPNGEAIGNNGAMIYSIDGTDLIVFFGFSVPYSGSNSCCVKIMKANEWNKEDMYKALKSSKFNSEHTYSGYKAKGSLVKGTSPYCTFEISKS